MTAPEEATMVHDVVEMLDRLRRRRVHVLTAAEVHVGRAVAAGADPRNHEVLVAAWARADLDVPRPVLELPGMDPRLSALVGGAVQFFVDHECES
ncbi:hypothetical protein GCM10009613_11580 [Pseudonocardia kongjuensis]|uniref:Tetracycline repressor TetR C-terminal domain-containing protein n=1 Tax=Pseudonocardia kongjuensis TaxID=102227 RepID=A0ABN1XQ47_9PSEU